MTKNFTMTILNANTETSDRESPRPRTLEFVRQFARTCINLNGVSSDPYMIAN